MFYFSRQFIKISESLFLAADHFLSPPPRKTEMVGISSTGKNVSEKTGPKTLHSLINQTPKGCSRAEPSPFPTVGSDCTAKVAQTPGLGVGTGWPCLTGLLPDGRHRKQALWLHVRHVMLHGSCVSHTTCTQALQPPCALGVIMHVGVFASELDRSQVSAEVGMLHASVNTRLSWVHCPWGCGF